MKTIKRISLATLVLVMVLSALLAIPASAAIPGDSQRDIFSSSCNDANFTAYAHGHLTELGAYAYARTYFSHGLDEHTSSGSAYVSGKFWYTPHGSSSYRTAVYSSTVSDDTTYPAYESRMSALAEVNSSSISGTVFSVESTHTLTMVCGGRSNTQTKWISVGEPAMK